MANADKGIKGSSGSKWGRSRVLMLIVIGAILIVGLILAIFALRRWNQQQELNIARLSGAPRSIQSIPGVKTTPEVAKNIREANLQRAIEAERRGTSAVPTINQPGYTNIPGVRGETPAMPEGTVAGCDPKELERARLAGVRVDELRCKGCSASQLHAAGYAAGDLVLAGFSTKELRDAGYTATALKDAGLNAKELITEGGFGISDLKTAGYTPIELKAAGGIDVKNMIAAGYTPAELRTAGYTSTDLKSAGLTLNEMKEAGYTPADLRKAGYSALDLKQAGYTPLDLVAAGFTDEQLSSAEVPADQIKVARTRLAAFEKGVSKCQPEALLQARNQGISAADLKKSADCPPAAFKTAGYNVVELRAAGLDAKALKAAGFTPLELKTGGYDAKQMKNLGYNTSALKGAGFTVGDLRRAGFTGAELAKAPFTASELHEAGLSAEDLKEADFTPTDLKTAGYSDGEMIRAGYTPTEIAVASKEMSAALAAAEKVQVPSTSVVAEEHPSARAPAVVVTPPPPPPPPREPKPPRVKQVPTPTVTEIPPAPKEPQTALGTSLALPESELRAETELERLQKRQAKQMTVQQREETLRKIEASMATQANDLFGSWSPPPTQVVVRGEQVPNQPGVPVPGGVPVNTPVGPAGAPGTGPVDENKVLKAGTILFAVLDTGINSDEQSPILATIVQSGPLKGSKLLGQFQRVDKKVLLNFNTLSVPTMTKSMAINAVAIDPDTARTALASHVDNHYLLRYGTFFASAFLSGLATAIAESGSTTIFQPIGNTTVTNPTTSVGEKGLIALGNVGQQFASTLGQNFQKPPTITVAAGSAVGILLMADLALPNS